MGERDNVCKDKKVRIGRLDGKMICAKGRRRNISLIRGSFRFCCRFDKFWLSFSGDFRVRRFTRVRLYWVKMVRFYYLYYVYLLVYLLL